MFTAHDAHRRRVSDGEEVGEWKLADLSEASGVPPRSIRLYIAKGLLMGPLRRGRDAAYGREHLERLQEIQRLQKQGLTLHEIARALVGPSEQVPLPERGEWQGYAVAPDVMVLIRSDRSAWRVRHVRAAVARLASQLQEDSAKESYGS